MAGRRGDTSVHEVARLLLKGSVLYALGDGCRERGQQAGLGFLDVGGRRLGIEARTAQLDVMGRGAWSMQSSGDHVRPATGLVLACRQGGAKERQDGFFGSWLDVLTNANL